MDIEHIVKWLIQIGCLANLHVIQENIIFHSQEQHNH